MTTPTIQTVTVPHCGACGRDIIAYDDGDDVWCDGCGHPLTYFGFGGLLPPTDLAAVGGSLTVTFTWTAADDTQDLLYQIDGGTPVLIEGATAAGEVVAATAGQKVAGAVRTVLNGVAGPFTEIVAATATA